MMILNEFEYKLTCFWRSGRTAVVAPSRWGIIVMSATLFGLSGSLLVGMALLASCWCLAREFSFASATIKKQYILQIKSMIM